MRLLLFLVGIFVATEAVPIDVATTDKALTTTAIAEDAEVASTSTPSLVEDATEAANIDDSNDESSSALPIIPTRAGPLEVTDELNLTTSQPDLLSTLGTVAATSELTIIKNSDGESSSALPIIPTWAGPSVVTDQLTLTTSQPDLQVTVLTTETTSSGDNSKLTTNTVSENTSALESTTVTEESTLGSESSTQSEPTAAASEFASSKADSNTVSSELTTTFSETTIAPAEFSTLKVEPTVAEVTGGDSTTVLTDITSGAQPDLSSLSQPSIVLPTIEPELTTLKQFTEVSESNSGNPLPNINESASENFLTTSPQFLKEPEITTEAPISIAPESSSVLSGPTSAVNENESDQPVPITVVIEASTTTTELPTFQPEPADDSSHTTSHDSSELTTVAPSVTLIETTIGVTPGGAELPTERPEPTEINQKTTVSVIVPISTPPELTSIQPYPTTEVIETTTGLPHPTTTGSLIGEMTTHSLDKDIIESQTQPEQPVTKNPALNINDLTVSQILGMLVSFFQPGNATGVHISTEEDVSDSDDSSDSESEEGSSTGSNQNEEGSSEESNEGGYNLWNYLLGDDASESQEESNEASESTESGESGRPLLWNLLFGRRHRNGRLLVNSL